MIKYVIFEKKKRLNPLIQKTDCSGPYLAELRGNMLIARQN